MHLSFVADWVVDGMESELLLILLLLINEKNWHVDVQATQVCMELGQIAEIGPESDLEA